MIRWMSQDNDKSRVGMKDELEMERLKSEESVDGRETRAIFRARENENISRILTRRIQRRGVLYMRCIFSGRTDRTS